MLSNDTRQQVKQRQLEILDEIDRICKKHNIYYVLVGGTCIGAIRHHGMIPWDDDLDIAMYRKDYDRFVEICKTELFKDYYIQDMDNTKGVGLVFSKVRDKQSIFSEQYCKNVKTKKGIWIDIFQYDNVSDNEEESMKDNKKVRFWNSFLTIKDGYKINLKTIKLKIQYYIIKFITLFMSEQFIKNKINNIIHKYDNIETKYVIPYGGQYNPKKERMLKSEFLSSIEVEFEGRKLPTYKFYDKYLSNLYGDYMKLPPIEEQVSYSHGIIEVTVNKRSED